MYPASHSMTAGIGFNLKWKKINGWMRLHHLKHIGLFSIKNHTHSSLLKKKKRKKNLFWVILHNHKHLIKTTTEMSGTVPLLHLKISNIKIIFYFFYFLSNYTYLGMQRNLCTHTDLLLCSSRCLHQLDCNTDSAGGGWGGGILVCVCVCVEGDG